MVDCSRDRLFAAGVVALQATRSSLCAALFFSVFIGRVSYIKRIHIHRRAAPLRSKRWGS